MIGTAATARARRVALMIGFGTAIGLSAVPRSASAQIALDPINLAQGKSARQSSQYGGASANLAVDGNTDGNFWDGSVTHTQSETHAWWEVDLGVARQVGRVEIWNRTDCCGDRLSPFMVIAADFNLIDTDITDADDQTYPGVMRTIVPNQGQAHIVVPINRSARFIRIALVNPNPLSLAEVQVIEADSAARGRSASQLNAQPGGSAAGVVDGNTSVTATTLQAQGGRWDLDLGMQYDVREIHVWCPHSDVFDPNAAQALVYASALPINGPTEFSATVDQLMPAIIPVDRRVRYLRIFPTSTTTGSLPLAEVQVFAYGRGSVGGHAVSAVGNATELQAIDFNRSTVFGDSTARTQPYWDLDLGGHRYLETIKLWTQGDPSMTTFHLFASDNDFVDASGKRLTSLQTVQGTPGVSHWIGRGTSSVTAISVMRQARFVRVQLDGTAAIKFSDVEIATTEGFAIGELPDESELRINASVINRPYSSYDILPVFDVDRTWVVNGHFPRANTRINAYAFTPNADGKGGTYALYASTTSGSTPELTGYGAAPQYPFSFASSVFPGGWLVGSVGTVMYSADDNDGFTPTPIRGIDASASGSEHVYWPDIRIASGSPTPDDTIQTFDSVIPPSAPPYLERPAKDDTIAGYPNNDLLPTTLTAFKNKYGPQLNTWIHATYYNAGDLGIGRDMYCRAPVGTPYKVCMVDNYARVSASGKPIFGDPVGAGGSQAKKVATVVMVSVNGTSAGFAAYDANGNRLNGIALDATGKHVKIPNNCLTCHSGMPTTFSNGQTYQGRAWFLPFDVSSFQDLGTHKLSDQAGAFAGLNLFVLTKSPTDMTALRELINGWYHNNPYDSEQPFDDSFVPPGWTKTPGDAKFYTDVIKPYCRTCHVMQSSSTGALDFRNANDAQNLRASILAYVCTIRQMPHAQQTLKRFWNSGARAQLLGYFGRGDFLAACGR